MGCQFSTSYHPTNSIRFPLCPDSICTITKQNFLSPFSLHTKHNKEIFMETRPTAVCHIVTMPYPGWGHINPILNLCKIIATKQSNILITFVVTEEWFGLIGNDSKPNNIVFATIPNVLPSEHVRARKFQEFVEAVMDNMEGPFEQVMDRFSHPPSVILVDVLLFWAIKIGNRRNIPVAMLITTSMTAFKHVILTCNPLEEDNQTSVDLPEKGDERISHISKTSANGSVNQPSPGQEKETFQRILHAFSWAPKAQYLLLASVQELEQEAFDFVRSQLSIPLYTVGPDIPYLKLDERPSSDPKESEFDYLQWLDSQPNNSVLYVSFGSFLSVSTSQMEEIAAGLCASGVRFLWVARDESTRLKDLLSGNGIVLPWCDQLRVLTHHSIGGFWTHCGWGSIMEGIFAGVPFLAFPIGMDQGINCKLVVEDWKVGWKASAATRREIERLVLKFMDLQDDESRVIRQKAKELQEVCQQAIKRDGSTQVNIHTFIRNVSQGYGH